MAKQYKLSGMGFYSGLCVYDSLLSEARLKVALAFL